jgi:hypothetical protein
VPLLEAPPELAVLPVEDVRDHRPEGDPHPSGSVDQLQGYLGFGAKGRIRLAAFEVVRGGVGLYLQRVVEPLVGVHRAYRDHPVGYLAYPSEVLMPHVGGSLTVLARSPVSSMTKVPEPTGAVSGPSSIDSTLRGGLCARDPSSTRRGTTAGFEPPCAENLPRARCWPGR